MTTTKFNKCDSWAFWNIPDEIENATDERAAEILFKDAYQSHYFPTNQLPTELSKKLKDVKYVLVGLNPGDAGVSLGENDTLFMNFHGASVSRDWRLAAALYGTDMWGAFMTDLVHISESDSSKVSANLTDVQYLEKHLDDLGISKNAVLIAMGGKAFDAIKKTAQRPVRKLPHYSGSNTSWKAEKTKVAIQEIINEFA